MSTKASGQGAANTLTAQTMPDPHFVVSVGTGPESSDSVQIAGLLPELTPETRAKWRTPRGLWMLTPAYGNTPAARYYAAFLLRCLTPAEEARRR